MTVSASLGWALHRPRQQRDADKQRHQNGAHRQQGISGIARARFFERRNPVGDGLHTGEGRAAAAESAQNQEQRHGLKMNWLPFPRR